MVLDRINKPNDIKKIAPEEYDTLAKEIRRFLVETTSKKGGHLASNLGVVELTMALHLCFDFPKDKVIWDVGHQAYTHKLLSGRKDKFGTLREHGGLSGFPKRSESDFDVFDTGHSTTSVSAGMGLAAARNLKNEKEYIISVIGDGSLTGGMAYEALNNISAIKGNYIIVLNDNNMSISQNVGGISNILNDVRSNDSYYNLKQGVTNTLMKLPKGDKLVDKIRNTKTNLKHMLIPNYIFEDMGVKYLGPVDGHDMERLIKIFNIAKRINKPVLVHILTQKGKGYRPAANDPSRFHGVGPFDIKTGTPYSGEEGSYSYCFGKKLTSLAAKNRKICAITAAMPNGTGLDEFEKKYPDRFYDVGIAEEHAVTFAAGLAVGGIKPFFAVYSSFLQRSYDQILHDVCLQNLPVVFAIDRAGIVGKDGETHQGIFDLSYLSIIPNMSIIAPSSARELELAMDMAVDYNAPLAIRYPRGNVSEYEWDREAAPYEYGKLRVVQQGQEIAIISAGNMMEEAVKVSKLLEADGIVPTIADARFVKPIDEEGLKKIAKEHKVIVTLEENVLCGGFGQNVLNYLYGQGTDARIINVALPDRYLEHGTKEQLRAEYGLDADSIYRRIKS